MTPIAQRWIASLLIALAAATLGIGQEPLPGTAPLVLPENLTATHWQQVVDYFGRRIERARQERDALWQPDFSSPAAYARSLTPHRNRLRAMLGLEAPGSGLGPAQRQPIAIGEAVRIERLTIPVADGLTARAVAFLPLPVQKRPAVIVCPDSDAWPERFCGIEQNTRPADWLRTLLGAGIAVVVPQSVERTTDHPYCQRVNQKDRRWVLYRLGYVVGRSLPGLEVQEVLAIAAHLRSQDEIDPEQLGIVGIGQGGMTALFAAAFDDQIRTTVVIDYFGPRERCWAEPVDRRLHRQLPEFGDAEVAALVAPRRLVVIHSESQSAAVEPERRRAMRFYHRLQADAQLSVIPAAANPMDQAAAVVSQSFQKALGNSRPALVAPVPSTDAMAQRDRHFEERLAFLRRRIEDSERERYARWRILERPAADFPEVRSAMLKEYRALVGTVPRDGTPLEPRTQLVLTTRHYRAYRVMLRVVDGVDVYGNLLVPHGIRGKRPAIICQHGLNGVPEMITGIDQKSDTPYHEFGRKLVERGYVVFAPLLLHHHPAPRIDEQVRKADAVGMMRVALPVAKTERVIDFLETLPFVDSRRIGYYGLSYGGYTALWSAPLIERLRAVVVSGHFNDWRSKITADDRATSYLLHPDEDFYNWNILPRFTHVELVLLTLPRPVCIEFGLRDGITTPQWTAYAWQQLAALAAHAGLADRVLLAQFDGVHEVHGGQTFAFLDKYLGPPVD